MYKQQEDYLCFDGDFDDNDNDDDDTDSSKVPLPSIIPTTPPTTAASDLLLTLINQVPATPPSPSQLPLSQFNFSYIDVTPPRTTPGPSADSDIVPFKPIPCDEYSTATLPTTSLERTTSYSLLSSQLLVPSQFIKLSYGDDHYCTVFTPKQRPATLLSSIPNTITETFTPSLRDTPSRSVSPDEVSNYHPYSFSSSVDVGLMMIMILIILPTILITILTILPMMLFLLPAVILTHEEQAISPNTNTVITTTVSMTIPLDATPAPTFSHDPGKRKELCLQR